MESGSAHYLFCGEAGRKAGSGHVARVNALAEDFEHPHHLVLLAPAVELPQLHELAAHFACQPVASEAAPCALASMVDHRSRCVFVLDGIAFRPQFVEQLRHLHSDARIVLIESMPSAADFDMRISPFALYPVHQTLDNWVLRREFDALLSMPRPTAAEVMNVLLIMGGADIQEWAERLIIPLAAQLPHAQLDVVCAQACEKKIERLQRLASAAARIRLRIAPAGLARIMQRADLAVSAGGFTAFELGALGVPLVLISTAAHEDTNCGLLETAGCARTAGRFGDSAERVIARLGDLVPALAADFAARRAMAAAGRALVPPGGRARVQEQILAVGMLGSVLDEREQLQ